VRRLGRTSTGAETTDWVAITHVAHTHGCLEQRVALCLDLSWLRGLLRSHLSLLLILALPWPMTSLGHPLRLRRCSCWARSRLHPEEICKVLAMSRKETLHFHLEVEFHLGVVIGEIVGPKTCGKGVDERLDI